MDVLLQTLLFGILRSGVYALTALGLAISLGVIGVVNFAHGEFVMLGAFIGYWVYLALSGALGLGPAVSPLVIVVSGPLAAILIYFLGRALFRLALRPVLQQPELNQMLLTFGLSLLIQNSALIVLGPQAREANLSWRFELLDLGFVNITYARLAVFGVSMALVAAVYLAITHSRLGKQMRAVAQNRLGAQIVGIPVDRIYSMAFGLSVALAGVAGVMLIFQAEVSPFLGLGIVLRAFAIVVLAGLGNLRAVVAASVFLGVAEQLAAQYAPNGAALRDGLFFILIFATLIVRPAGLGRG